MWHAGSTGLVGHKGAQSQGCWGWGLRDQEPVSQRLKNLSVGKRSPPCLTEWQPLPQ